MTRAARGWRTKFTEAKTVNDITIPIYRVLYKGEMLFCESSASAALARLPRDTQDWTIEARVEFKTWTCWPPGKATRPKEDES